MSLRHWLGKRVRFEADGETLEGWVVLTSETRLTIRLDPCPHTGCKVHPDRWYGRMPGDVTAI